MEDFCRGCLVRYDPMEMLQYTEKYRRLFVYSTGLQVKRNDAITFQLCKDCFLNMKASCKFKKLCRASDKKLKSYLALKNVGNGVDFDTFLKNNDDTMAFRLPLMSGSSTPVQNNKSKDDDNESTCTSIRNFMTDILQGEEMPDTEARIIREVIEEEADVLDDSLDSHWLQDDVSIDTDFRLDFSLSPFATPHSVNNDHCYTPKRYGDSNDDQLKKYFTSVSPARQHMHVNDFTDVIRNNQSEKELCVFRTDEVNGEISINNIDMPINENALNHLDLSNSNNQKSLDSLHLSTINNEKSVSNFDLPIINNERSVNDLDFSIVDNEKSINNLNPPIIEEEKSLNNLDLSSLPSIDNETSINNLDLPSFDSEKSINNLDLPSFDNEKSINSLDLLSLPSNDNERSTNNLDLPMVDNDNGNYDQRINIPNFYVPTDGTAYITASKEIEKIVDAKKLKKEKSCTIDKNLEKALRENGNKKEFSLNDLLVSPQVFHDASGASTPTISNILFGDKVNYNERNSKKYPEYLVETDMFEKFFQDDEKELQTVDKNGESDIKDDFKVPMDVDEVDTGTKQKNQKYKLSTELDEKQYDLDAFLCYICDKKFETSKALCIHFTKKHHIKIIKPKSFANKYGSRICSVCGKQFNDLQSFHRHLKDHKILQKDRRPLKCDHCLLEFSSQSKLNKHKSSHNNRMSVEGRPGNFVCTACGARSTTIGNFRLHQRRHTNDFHYTCVDCGKGFFRLSDFNTHMRIHTGAKPFSCVHCDSTFARKGTLIKHVKIHIGDKRFQCEHCDLAFTARYELNKHVKTSKSCMRKRGIILDEEIPLQKDKRKNQEVEIEDDLMESKKDKNGAMINVIEIRNQLPYIDTEISN